MFAFNCSAVFDNPEWINWVLKNTFHRNVLNAKSFWRQGKFNKQVQVFNAEIEYLSSNGPGLSPGQDHCVVLLGKTLYSHNASLLLGVTLRWINIPFRGSSNTPSCFMLRETRVKHQPHGPLGPVKRLYFYYVTMGIKKLIKQQNLKQKKDIARNSKKIPLVVSLEGNQQWQEVQ